MRRSVAMRGGFTLVEMLLVISILVILVSLALPAVQGARESARRMTCQANLRQIGLAVAGYQADYGCWPIGGTNRLGPPGPDGLHPVLYRGEYSVHARLLPYLEAMPLYHAINFDVGTCAPTTIGYPRLTELELQLNNVNATAARTSLGVFVCASDGHDGQSLTNYRGNVGVGCNPNRSWLHPDSGNGFLGELQLVGPRDCRDGLSSTVAFSEKLVGSGATPLTGGAPPSGSRDAWMILDGVVGTADDLLTACQISARPGYRDFFGQGGHGWLWAGRDRTFYSHTQEPNGLIPDCFQGALRPPPGMATARSNHPNGVNALFGDGSVRFVKDSLDRALWRSMGTRNGGELVE